MIGSRQFDSNSSGIFQIPRIVELRNSIPHFPLGMEMEPTSNEIGPGRHWIWGVERGGKIVSPPKEVGTSKNVFLI